MLLKFRLCSDIEILEVDQVSKTIIVKVSDDPNAHSAVALLHSLSGETVEDAKYYANPLNIKWLNVNKNGTITVS